MRDSPVATRYDRNHVINIRWYRRSDHVAPPEPTVSGGRACSRPVTLPSLTIYEVVVVLLARTLQVLVLLLPRTIWVLVLLRPHPPSPPTPHHLSPLPAAHPQSPPPTPTLSKSCKTVWKTINKLTLQNGMKISMLPQIFDSRSFDP
jgi:hypothetical protein